MPDCYPDLIHKIEHQDFSDVFLDKHFMEGAQQHCEEARKKGREMQIHMNFKEVEADITNYFRQANHLAEKKSSQYLLRQDIVFCYLKEVSGQQMLTSEPPPLPTLITYRSSRIFKLPRRRLRRVIAAPPNNFPKQSVRIARAPSPSEGSAG